MHRLIFLLTFSTLGADAGVLPSHGSSELVYPQLLEERAANGELMLHITDDLVLTLRKSSVAAPLLRLITTENGKEVTNFLDGKAIESTIYHDVTTMASVSITQAGSGIEVEGLISPKKRIEPAREQARLATGLIPHVIYAIDSGGVHDSVIYNHKMLAPDPVTARSISGTETVPKKVTVEIFVISDTHHSQFFHNKTKLTVYVCLIINVANIRLSETSDPTIQLLFTGIEVSKNEPYLNDKGYMLNAETTIQALGRYAFHVKQRLGYPDTLYLFTGRDAYGQRWGRSDRGLRGLGYDNGLCSDWFVALGEDVPGTFSGADTFAHEVAHLLGASHDGQPPDPRYPGRPGAQHCPFHYGYLMGNAKRSRFGHHYSQCSLQQMRYIVRLRGSACWRVTAIKTYNVTKKYPGMVLTMEAYCQRKFAEKNDVTASEYFKAQCSVRCLYNEVHETNSNGHSSFQDVEALEYTPCGNDQVCIQGDCVQDPKKRNNKRP